MDHMQNDWSNRYSSELELVVGLVFCKPAILFRARFWMDNQYPKAQRYSRINWPKKNSGFAKISKNHDLLTILFNSRFHFHNRKKNKVGAFSASTFILGSKVQVFVSLNVYSLSRAPLFCCCYLKRQYRS